MASTRFLIPLATAAFAAETVLAGLTGPVPMGGADTCSLRATPDGKSVEVLDSKGTHVLTVGDNNFWCLGPVTGKPCGAKKISDTEWTIDYAFDPRVRRHPTAQTVVRLRGGPMVEFSPRFTIPADGRKEPFEDHAGFHLTPTNGMVIQDRFVKTGVWTRSASGGEPYERKGVLLKQYMAPHGESFLWFFDDGNNFGHGNKENRHRLRYDITAAPGGGSNCASRAVFFHFPEAGRRVLAEAVANRQPVALWITTPVPFNLFDSSKNPAGCYDVRLMNPGADPQSGTLVVTAYDWDGRRVENFRAACSLKPFQGLSWHGTLPAAPDGVWFVEAAFKLDKPYPDPLWKPAKADLKKAKAAAAPEEPPLLAEVFTRAHVATMTPYIWRHQDSSIMGMAATFFVPTMEDMLALEKRIGVKWQRFGGSKEEFGDNRWLTPRYGMVSIYSQGPDGRITNAADRVAFVARHLRRALERGCPYFEFGNEFNFGDDAKGEVDYYLPWAEAMRAALKEVPCKGRMRITTFGYAGADPANLEGLWQRGGMDVFDDISLHPGRLGQTPDCPGPFWAWNYRSAITCMKGVIQAHHGRQGMIMTEVYARTAPNRGDSDSLRMAAENVFLSCVIAKAEGISALFWYQMQDGVHNDIGGADPNDTEHHYGLVRRDNTIKPSLLAYKAVAQILDGATFLKRVSRTGTKLDGWCFDTPRGRADVLFDRTDGFAAYPDMTHGHLDPWLQHWKTVTPYVFRSDRKTVEVVDCIGRRSTRPVKNGQVTLELDGAPVAVYGLNL